MSRRRSESGIVLDEFTTSDAGFQLSFMENKAKLNLYVGNLFGTNYQEIYGQPMPRQTVGMTLKYRFF